MIESAHLLNKLLLPSPLERYWRLGPTSTINQVTLFVDFEGLSIFLGRHGQFGRKLEEITRALLTAARVYGPVLRAKFYADWDRYTDEAKALNDLKSDPDYHFLEHVFYLIEDELVTANIARDAFDLAQQFGHNQCFIIMCSRPGLEEHIQKLQQFGQVIIWGAGRDAEKTYRVCANQFAAIDNLLGIPLREELSYQAEETLLQLIAIIIDNDLTLRRFETVSLNQMIQLLARSTIPTFRWSRWWINLAVNRCLIRRADLKLDRVLYRLDPQSPIVQKAIELKEQILVTLDTLTQQGRKTTVAHLERTLRTNSALSYDEGRHFWIDMLRHDGLIQEEPLTLDNDLPPITVNRNDPRVRPIIQGRQHLDHLIVTMANLLLENPTYRWLRPRQVKERLESRFGGSKVVQSTFNLAESTGIIRFVERESDKGRVFQIYFDNNHPRVIQSLSVRDRVICLTHDWLRMYQVITVDKLATLLATAIPDQNEAFRLRWITILQEEGILKSESSTDAAPPTYSLDESSVVVKSVLLPIYLKLLIYVVGHHEPSEQYPAPGAKRLVKQLAEQTKSESLAQAVLDLGKQQRMLFIRTIEDERFHSGRLSFVELNDNGKRLLNILNEQQAEVRKNIIYLLETQERNWFPFGALMDLMRSQMHFGALDAERHFWIQRMVEERILTRQTSKGSTGQVVYTLAV